MLQDDSNLSSRRLSLTVAIRGVLGGIQRLEQPPYISHFWVVIDLLSTKSWQLIKSQKFASWNWKILRALFIYLFITNEETKS